MRCEMAQGSRVALFGELFSYEGKRKTSIACTVETEQNGPLIPCYINIECTTSACHVNRLSFTEEIAPLS